jgi:hypothetical protein
MCARYLSACVAALLLTSINSAFAALPSVWRTVYAPTTNQLRAAALGKDRIVVVGGGDTIFWSLNGFEWMRVSNRFGNDIDFSSIAYGNDTFVAGSNLKARWATSYDGVSWSATTGNTGGERINGLVFGNGRFVGVGTPFPGSPGYVATSVDGIQWAFPTSPTTNVLNAVTYGNGLFVAVGAEGTIITSPDTFNWTLRFSGTRNELRTVTYTGSNFIAGGQSATTISSRDGISWPAAAPPAFDVRALAAGGGAVVVAGNFQGEGRYHASEDGLTWPGNFQTAPRVLAGVAYLDGRFFVLGNSGLILQSDVTTPGLANRWTKATSGYWEEPYWSLGELPSRNQLSIELGNSGWKALAIGSGTVANYPASLQVRNLFVYAPWDSANLLLLNYAGLAVPLDISDELRIGQGGSLLSCASGLRAKNFYLDGEATFAEESDARFEYVALAQSAFPTTTARLTLSNAVLSIGTLDILGSYAQFNQYGGSNHVGSMRIFQDHGYNLSNGTLVVSGTATLQGFGPEVPEVTISGGLAQFNVLKLGVRDEGRGVVLLTGGTLESDIISADGGRYYQSGGTSRVGNMVLPENGTSAFGSLGGGTLTSGYFTLGRLSNSTYVGTSGRFEQRGGVHVNTNRIEVLGKTNQFGGVVSGIYNFLSGRLESPLIHAASGLFEQLGGTAIVSFVRADARGSYHLRGGVLFTPRIEAVDGTFWQMAGTNHTGDILVQGSGAYAITAGTVTSSNVLVAISRSTNERPQFYQRDAVHIVQNTLRIDSAGRYDLASGTLIAPTIRVEAMGEFYLSAGGTVSSNSTFFLRPGGTLIADGDHQLGPLRSVDGTIDFGTNSTILRFTDAGYPPQALDGYLYLRNWSGSAISPGTDQLYVGTITPYQLALTRFIHPAGYPPGIYAAQVKPTGEIVPMSITYMRPRNYIVLTWPGTHLLVSSTNVTGPYEPVSNARSPYTNYFTDPRRFFLIRSYQ